MGGQVFISSHSLQSKAYLPQQSLSHTHTHTHTERTLTPTLPSLSHPHRGQNADSPKMADSPCSTQSVLPYITCVSLRVPQTLFSYCVLFVDLPFSSWFAGLWEIRHWSIKRDCHFSFLFFFFFLFSSILISLAVDYPIPCINILETAHLRI